jgi:glycosyltransferase involved in cell wall biosynthesis
MSLTNESQRGANALVLPTGSGKTRVGIVSTYPPTRCGIARYTEALVGHLGRVAPDLEVDVIRIIDEAPPISGLGQVGMEFDPRSPVSVRAAARHLDRCDLAIIQHEYGIFGDDDGESVLDLADLSAAPLVTVAHTVVSNPSDRQRRILNALHERSSMVVLSEAARSALAAVYDIRRSEVVVIPHGSRWAPAPPRFGPRREIVTWGLLGPGKGLEKSIEAMTMLRDIEPTLRYRIVGRTHPVIARRSGSAFRRSLEEMVRSLGLEHMVEFVDRYLSDNDLYRLVAESDIVVTPYETVEQVTSGVLADAVAAGRPVVSTRFPHAVELLGSGAGLVVEHESSALAAGLRALLEDDDFYRHTVRRAAVASSEVSWESGAKRYADLVRSLVPAGMTIDN